jgi:hypothetical protein
MTRRLWTWMLCAGLAGCAHTGAHVEGPPPATTEAPHVDMPVVSAPPVSPYHVLPTPTPAESGKAAIPPLVPPMERLVIDEDLKLEPPRAPDMQPFVVPVTAKAPVPENPLQGALRCFLDNRPAEAVRLFNHYDKSSQELLLCLLPLAVRLTQTDLDHANPQEVDALLDQLYALAAPMKQRAPLKLGTVCFCERVQQFGVYDPLGENPELRPGDEMHLYVELKNFSTVADVRGFKIPLEGRIEVISFEGKTVFQHSDVLESASLSPRQDLFVRFPFFVPQRLPQGSYIARFTIEDLVTHRKVTRSLDFRIKQKDVARGS